MRRLLNLILFLGIISCGRPDKKVSLKVPEGYRGWKKPVDRVMDYIIPGHGKTFRVIYANETAFNPDRVKDSNGSDRIVYRDGSHIIKEVYQKREDIGKVEPVLTIMKKDKNNTMALNGWVYSVKKPGKDPLNIKTRLCIGCHESANEAHPYFDRNPDKIFRDYIFVPIKK